jgi:chromosome segregation ATPase
MAGYVPQGYQSVSGDPSGYLTQYENQGFEQFLEDDVDDNGNSSHPAAPTEGRTATGKGKKPQQPEKKKDPYKALASIEQRLATRVKNLEKAQKVLQNHFTRLAKMEADKDRYREENLEDQRNKIARKQNEINGLQEAIHDLEERRETARNETVQHTLPTTSQEIEVKPKKRRKKTKRPDTWDPFEGDDSASDKGEPLKKQKQSCRHCQVRSMDCVRKNGG